MEKEISQILHSLGIPSSLRGYVYLRTAILKAVTDSNMIDNIVKQLYPAVAVEHNTTPSKVERSMRHAITVAWNRGDIETLTNYFGYTIDRERGKATNSEFIAMIADNIRLERMQA